MAFSVTPVPLRCMSRPHKLNIPGRGVLFSLFLQPQVELPAQKTLNRNGEEGIYIQGTMSILPIDSIQRLPFPRTEAVARSAGPSEDECEVIRLFDQHRNGLLRYTLSFGLSMHDAEEIIQEAFLALFQHLRMGKSRHNLRGWIFRVAHNLALKQRARNDGLRRTVDYDEATMVRQRDDAPNPEEQAASGQRIERLRAVVAALSEQDRCCLYLRAAGLRYREIATTLGISIGSVSATLARSLARLGRADGGFAP
jgi:RNA polymerase sigma-70 factor, ECF subfamily